MANQYPLKELGKFKVFTTGKMTKSAILTPGQSAKLPTQQSRSVPKDHNSDHGVR